MSANRNRYRAWDGNRIYHNVAVINGVAKIEVNPTGDHIMTDKAGVSYYSAWATYQPIKNAVLLQSTGLADENDVEMFDGDIVSFVIFDHNDNDTAYVGKIVHEDSVVTIHSFEEDGCFGSDGPFDLWWVHTQDDTMTVMGNVYQNPELFDPDFNMAEDEEAKTK